jgi:glutamate-1-semialdehyde aminotransferase
MGTEAVRFFKSGSDALSCAVRLARAATGRQNIVIFDKSYHGTASEFGPIGWHQAGYPPTPAIVLPFGQPLDLMAPLSVAAIVVEPVPKSIEVPPVGWLEHLGEVCDEHGIVLISDEVILGYRHTLGGYMHSIGIKADLYCYGKAMAQGAALSACTGRKALMDKLISEVHFSGTNNGENTSLDIAMRTLAAYRALAIPSQLSELGQFFRDVLHDVGFATNGLNERFEVMLPSSQTRDATGYCFDRGILFPGWISVALSQTRNQIHRLVEVLCRWRETQP